MLYRTNFQSRQIEEALRRYGRKYIVVGGFSFYRRAEIKDMLAYLKAAGEPARFRSACCASSTRRRAASARRRSSRSSSTRSRTDLSVWTAIGRMLEERAFGTRADSALAAFPPHDRGTERRSRRAAARSDAPASSSTGPAISGCSKADPSPEAESRIGNLQELLNAAADAAERGETLADFLDHAALVSDADQVDNDAQVSLLTIHNAKGLEFPVVFLAGMEEGLFPHSRSLDSEAQMEEERRLCYVGMTRAEKRLYISLGPLPAPVGRRAGRAQHPIAFPGRDSAGALTEQHGRSAQGRRVDLYAERHYVRESARRNLYTGKTYNSVENISQFFSERGMPPLRPGISESAGWPRQCSGEPVARRSRSSHSCRSPGGSGAAPKKKPSGRVDHHASEVRPRHGAAPGRRGRRREADRQFPGLRLEEDYREIRRNQDE